MADLLIKTRLKNFFTKTKTNNKFLLKRVSKIFFMINASKKKKYLLEKNISIKDTANIAE